MKRREEIVFFRDLGPEKAAELRRRLAGDPEARELLSQWLRMQESIAASVNEAVPDTDLFVLFALAESGRADVLSPEERRRVDAEAVRLRVSLAGHPGLAAVAGDIHTAADEFDAEWERWLGDLPPSSGRDRTPSRRSRRGRWVVRTAIGASAMIFAFLLVLVLNRERSTTTIETAANEVRVVELGDGSSVRLVGASRLSYVPNGGPLSRRADLEGSGYFEIAPDARGFIVTTRNAQATVLGTSFSVRSDGSETEVVLAEGALSLTGRAAPEQIVVLEPGQMSSVTESQAPTTPIDVTVHEVMAWTGLFVFSSTSIDDILRQLARHYDAELSADPDLAGERVTGRFEHEQPLIDILEVVAAAVDARVQAVDAGGYRLVLR